MAIVFDPHETQSGNVVSPEPAVVVAGKYRMLAPKEGPYYTKTLKVYNAGTELSIGKDYVPTHPYMTGISKTGRALHGLIWVVNDALDLSQLTLSYHALGKGQATAAQIAQERIRNQNTYPSRCQWEHVIGDVYFPPVDIQFDWTGWKGEKELMDAIEALSVQLTAIPPVSNPLVDHPNTVTLSMNWDDFVDYGGHANFSGVTPYRATYGVGPYNGIRLEDYLIEILFNFNGFADSTIAKTLIFNVWNWLNSGQVTVNVYWDSIDSKIKFGMSMGGSSYTLAEFDHPRNAFHKPVRFKFERLFYSKTLRAVVKVDGVTKMDYTLDLDNPPANLVQAFIDNDVVYKLNRGTEFRSTMDITKNDMWTFLEFPALEKTDKSYVVSLIRQYHLIVDALYRNAPAHDHVTKLDNPHGDYSYGRMRAIELNGIASDADKVYGKTEAELTQYINQQVDLTQQLQTEHLLRHSNQPRVLDGTFITTDGATTFSAATDDESLPVETVMTIDTDLVRAIEKGSVTHTADTQPIVFRSHDNELVLYPDARGLKWNGKVILDPTTVEPFLPGNTSGGSGLFYGRSSATVTVTGNGIQTVPFVCTWVPPNASDPAVPAMRKLANVFGHSTELAATPFLIAQLDSIFTGKLNAATTYINGVSLQSSITISKFTINLDNVENISDADMPVSVAQANALLLYAQVGHTHDPSVFGIGMATASTPGLVKFGGLIDDPSVALDSSYVTRQLSLVQNLEKSVSTGDTAAVVDITRYGSSGNNQIEGQVTYTGWLLTVKPNSYFVGTRYTVPLATFNVAEIYPDRYQDNRFGIYVELVKGNAVYGITDNINLANTDTLTVIGEFATSDTQIVTASIRNITRLGDFRELDEHRQNVNAHVYRKLTQNDFGFSYGNAGERWTSGVVGTTRGLADWREQIGGNYVPCRGVTVNGDDFQFSATVDPVTFINVAELATVGVVDNAWHSITESGITVLENVLLEFQGPSRRMKFSLIITNGNTITSSAGSRCRAGLAIDYGTPYQQIVGLNTTAFINPGLWADAAPRFVYNIGRLWDGTPNQLPSTGLWTCSGTLSLLGKSYRFTLMLGTSNSVSLDDGTSTETIDLTSRLSATGIDVSHLTAFTDWGFRIGVGGVFSGPAAVSLEVRGAIYVDTYATSFDSIDNVSELNRWAVTTGTTTGGSLTALKTTALQDAFANAANRPNGMPVSAHDNGTLVYFDGSTYTAIFVRD